MPQATPKRAGRSPKPGSRFPEQVLADNVRAYRQLRRMSQEELAAGMAGLGHPWTAGVVGFVERGDRNVTVGELLGLALVLALPPGKLLDPAGPLGLEGAPLTAEEAGSTGLDVGVDEPLSFGMAGVWVKGELAAGLTTAGDVRFRAVPCQIDTDPEHRQLRDREALAETFNETRAAKATGKSTRKGRAKR